MDVMGRLAPVRRLTGLTEADLAGILASGQLRVFRAGEVIVAEGDPCAGLFVLLQGQVKLQKVGPQGQEQTMGIIRPVAPFNEVAALDCGPNPATAIAAQPSVTWRVDADRFQAVLRQHPRIGIGLLRVLAARTRRLVGHYEDLSFRSVQARTAKLLLEISAWGQEPIDRRKHTVASLASRIGSVEEPVSRSLRAMRELGVISSTRFTITVRRPDALATLAQVDLDARSPLPPEPFEEA